MIKVVEQCKGDIRYEMLPENLREGVQLYFERGCPPGHFLKAVICNDLVDAVGRADLNNQRNLAEIVKFFVNYIPAVAWGSEESYQQWIEAFQPDKHRLSSPSRTYIEGIDYPVGGQKPGF